MTAHARDRSVVKGMVAGIAGGLAASWAMAQFAAEWSRTIGGERPASSGGRHDARDWQERSEDRNATELVAQDIARLAIHRPLRRDELRVAAPLVHYAFGASIGALYGALAEIFGGGVAMGAGFGTLVWIVGDEIVVPALRWSDAPRSYSPEHHAQACASHVVYGTVTDLVGRGVRALI